MQKPKESPPLIMEELILKNNVPLENLEEIFFSSSQEQKKETKLGIEETTLGKKNKEHTKKIHKQELTSNELSKSKINFNSINDLEILHSYSTPLRLPSSCHEFIANINDSIPYLQYVQTLHKHGIVIITLGYEDNNAFTLEKIINFIGIPHAHKNKESIIWDIKNFEESKEKHIARSHQLSEFTLHTDCSYEEEVPEFFGLHVIQHDQMGGGKNLVVDIPNLLQYLSKKSLETLQKHPVRILVPKEFNKGKDFIDTFILDKKLNIRYRRELIDSTSLNTEQKEAIDELEQLIYSPFFNRTLALNKGKILLLDNKRYLHARTAIKDKSRHLKRIRFFSKKWKLLNIRE